MNGREITTALLNEVTFYGGIPLRRADVATLAAEHLGERDCRPYGSDYFAFHGLAVDREPWTLEAARELMQD